VLAVKLLVDAFVNKIRLRDGLGDVVNHGDTSERRRLGRGVAAQGRGFRHHTGKARRHRGATLWQMVIDRDRHASAGKDGPRAADDAASHDGGFFDDHR
jgi:hypothetical protein